ncbi:MAG: glycosyltransferase, partial [Paramuribaculum sp.]|nr:glycosyltransferase [Paramuribaculum sp.]
MTPIISIIIPVYNTGTYLRRCVDSILPQLPDESEIIIVDDGSTDSSPAICDDIAASDRRITAIHTHNGGASHARNTGIEASRGRYTMMVDSDDTLEPDRIIPLINRMEAERLDLLTFGIYDIIDGKRRLSNVNGKPNSAVSGAEYALRHTIEHSPCTFIVLRKTIGDLRFQEGVIMEDYSFCLELYERCRLVAHSPEAVYNYIIRQGSVSRSGSADADRHRMRCWKKILERMASRPWTETYRPAAQRWIAHYKL